MIWLIYNKNCSQQIIYLVIKTLGTESHMKNIIYFSIFLGYELKAKKHPAGMNTNCREKN